MNSERIVDAINESISIKEQLKLEKETIAKLCGLISQTINNGGKIFFMGNGGSAADAQHISAEFVGRYNKTRKGLPAIALTTNTSILTAIGNDFGYDKVFQRQVEAMVSAQDAIIGISTSGSSINVINAIIAAKKIGAKTIGLTGVKGGELAKVTDVTLCVPSDNTQRIQECHILIGHIICDAIEENLAHKFQES